MFHLFPAEELSFFFLLRDLGEFIGSRKSESVFLVAIFLRYVVMICLK